MTAPRRTRTGTVEWIETLLLILTGYACHLYYNLIGHIASLRGVDFGPWILTPLDRAIPYMPLWVHFYQLAYFVPAAVLILLVASRRVPLFGLRRLWVSFLALLAVHYALYLLLPTSAREVRMDASALGSGLLGDLVRTQYRIATVWCAWPSLHVSACWFFYRQLARPFPSLRWIYLVWFAGMAVGTVGIRIHFLADGLTGLLLAESAHRFLFLRLEARGACRWEAVPRSVVPALLAVALAVLLAALPVVMAATGFEGPLYTLNPGL